MGKENKKIWAFVFAGLFLLAVVADATRGKLGEDGVLERPEEESVVHLELDAAGVLENYEYELTVEPPKLTDEEAYKLLDETKQKIEEDFSSYEQQLPILESYMEGRVEAEWSYTPSGYIDSNGAIMQENIPEDGVLVTVYAELFCGNYEEIFVFPIRLEKRMPTQEELILEEMEAFFEKQMQQEGVSEVKLPQEIQGIKMQWKEKKEYISFQVLALEILAVILIAYLKKKEEQELEEKRRRQMEYSYCELLSQFTMLLETGMTMRQAWINIARQYQEKRKKGTCKTHPLYEAIVRMARRLSEGEKERVVYECFIEEINVPCYRRLMRTLIGNLEKGMAGITGYLQEEEKRAYTQRILLAKKLGEEASTKMLFPLMIMMVLVMGVVLAPAMIGFLN